MICELYPDKGGKWRFRFRSANGKRTATSGESFDSKGNARRAAGAFALAMKNAILAGGIETIDLRASAKARKK